MSRAVHHLAHGEILPSLSSNLLFIPWLVFTFYLWLSFASFAWFGRSAVGLSSSAPRRMGMALLAFTVARNANVAPFKWLAP